MAGEAVILKSEYPDQITTASFAININQADGVVTQCMAFDKRVVIDSIEVVGVRPAAAKSLDFYLTALGGNPTVAAANKLATLVDLDQATWTGPDGTARTVTSSATGWVSTPILTANNKAEAGSILIIRQNGAADTGGSPVIIVRYRERIS